MVTKLPFKMSAKEAKELVDEIGGEWFHDTPVSLIDLARALTELGMMRFTVETMIRRIIADMRNEYGD